MNGTTQKPNSFSKENFPLFQQNYVRSLTEHLFVSVGVQDQGDEPHMRKYARTIAVNWACNMGSFICRNEATSALRGITGGGNFHQNVRDVLYCSSLRGGGSFDFNFLWNRTIYSEDDSTRNVLLNSLGCISSRALLLEYVSSSLNSTNLGAIPYRSGEQFRVFNAVYQNSLTGLRVALDFLLENIEEAHITFGSNNFANTLTGLAQRIGSAELIEQVKLKVLC